MKNQVKKFSQYINESDRFGMSRSKDAGNGIAVWKQYDYNSEVIFGDDRIQIDADDADYDDEGNFSGMRKIFSAAAELGASSDMIWSQEDDRLMYKDR